MATFTKDNLLGKYSWKAESGDNPKWRAKPDSTLLDRTEGYEVLYMIQSLMDKWDLKNIATGQKIENMIQKSPDLNSSRAKITAWISENWKKY